jgi:GTP-binding protein EngB required for normal cell division
MNYIEPIKNNVANYLWNKDFNESNILSNKEILKVASILNSSYIDNHLVDLPKLVVVGTQSSGKSSLLNSLIGLDILPVGKSMTTRTPLHLELIQSINENRIEFGNYNNYNWITEKKILINYPNLTTECKEQIRMEIESQTINKAGAGLNISINPIYIKIYANNVPNLSLIDLPGLTSVAITDKGQPKDIKEQIISLVLNYIKQQNTIILAIISARPDIEADMAMELVKQADPKGERTIGILTKLDLMNEDADVSMYLDNNVCSDLKLKYGYFGIRNRSNQSQTIQEALVIEKTYFQNHVVYKNEKYKSRLGIPIVSSNLSHILVNNIKQCLPKVLQDINKKLEETSVGLEELGSSVPQNKEIKINIINSLLSQYIKVFIHAIEYRGSTYQTGRKIKDSFDNFRKYIDCYNPFIDYDDEYIVSLLKSYDGMHMSFPYLPIEVLENTLKDKKIRPIYKLYEPSQKCLQETLEILNNLNQIILEDKQISKYPNLIKTINNLILNEVLLPKLQITEQKIKELIEQEESYIWTDDKTFLQLIASDFSKIIQNDSFDIVKFKKILYEYYKTIIKNVRENIPKCIVYHLIKNTTDNLSSFLYDKILSSDVNNLLEEYPEIEERRKYLEKNKKDLQEIKKLIENIF